MKQPEQVLENNLPTQKTHEIPRPLAIVGASLLVLNALYLGLWGFAVLGEVFAVSVSVGLVMLFTAVGFIPFAPLWLGIASLTWFERIPVQVSAAQYRIRVALCFFAGIVGPYLLYTFTTFATLIIAAAISNFVQ